MRLDTRRWLRNATQFVLVSFVPFFFFHAMGILSTGRRTGDRSSFFFSPGHFEDECRRKFFDPSFLRSLSRLLSHRPFLSLFPFWVPRLQKYLCSPPPTLSLPPTRAAAKFFLFPPPFYFKKSDITGGTNPLGPVVENFPPPPVPGEGLYCPKWIPPLPSFPCPGGSRGGAVAAQILGASSNKILLRANCRREAPSPPLFFFPQPFHSEFCELERISSRSSNFFPSFFILVVR